MPLLDVTPVNVSRRHALARIHYDAHLIAYPAGLDKAHAALVDPHPKEYSMRWLTYQQASAYTGWSIEYLRNLVSAARIPVYGRPRVRRFRQDMLDLFLSDPDVAMRKFLLERNAHGT